MTFNGDVQASGLASGKPFQLPFGLLHSRQHLPCQGQYPQTGSRESHRSRAPDQQGRTQPPLQILELMRQRRLGHMKAFRRFHQGTGLFDGQQGGQVSHFQHELISYSQLDI